MHPYLEAVRERVVVFDGATGTNLQERDLTSDDFGGSHLEGCNEVLVATRPDVIADLHRSFLDVGVDVVETDTFGAFAPVLAEYGIAGRARELNRLAAGIARDVARGYDGWVAGSIGPGTKMPTLGHIDFRTLRDAYSDQVLGLLEGGVDLLIIETVYDLLQAKAAVIGSRRAMADAGREVPIQVQVTMETTGRMLIGSEIGAALTSLLGLRPDVVGLNCATGPREMVEHLRHLSRHCPVPVSCLPNAGLPSVVEGRTHYDLTPQELADWHERFVSELGVSVVGGCCGTTPEHLRQVVERVRGLTPAARDASPEPAAASIYTATPYDQSPSVMLVGERTNANGSKAFREAMLDGDWDACVRVATDQIRESAHALDVCVDYVGRDGRDDMREIASRFAQASTLPLMLDSTEPEVLEVGLECFGGKALLNSANLEDGEGPESRFHRVMSLAKEHGAAVVCLTIEEAGQARTADDKLRIARRIHDLAVERYGIDPGDLFFDALALTLATGQEESRRDGIETLEGIRRIKAELPGVRTILGLSNISFGLKAAARHVLNSVFLAEAQAAGLDAAIVHAGKIVPLARIDERHREVCLDLIHDRRRDGYDPLQVLLGLFEGVSSATTSAQEDRSDWTVERRLEARIIEGDRNGLTDDLDEALAGGRPALSIVNDVLLEGMKVVGELFGSGQMQLPFVLQSAETMKAAVAHLEPHMEKADAGGKGRVVLATVKGDVHDIGKNLVDIILTNNGYEVHNLGIKVSIDDMVAKAREVGADAIGMSGLLVKSTIVMRENLQALNDQGLAESTPVLLGGAALTRAYVERDLRQVYEGRVFYGKDAFEGLRTMDRLMELKRSGERDDSFGREIGEARRSQSRIGRAAGADDATEPPAPVPARSPEVSIDVPVPTPPFWGTEVVKGIALDELAAWVNETGLYRRQWGFLPDKAAGEGDEAFRERMRGLFREQLAIATRDGVLVPQVAYGYFPANADGDDLVLWEDPTATEEIGRFTFPRQASSPHLCIADFFRPVGSGEVDVAPLAVVTMGEAVSERTAELFAADRYQDYLLLHGLGVELAEALAEMWHRRIREELGIAGEDGTLPQVLHKQGYRGGRFSWGYPACPDLEGNAEVCRLLDAERIGVTVSEGFQLVPEQTTLALICHHPQAKYFVA